MRRRGGRLRDRRIRLGRRWFCDDVERDGVDVQYMQYFLVQGLSGVGDKS